MAEGAVSKSRFKARALEHLRHVQETGKELVITDRGTPVVKVVPYERDPAARLGALRGSIRRYADPTKPVAERDWDASR
ncbi:MAG: type II toxin-antitoxin system prevent-host-death family antitoxin [Chloroflexi bacterium]|nr:type II toxin-antitoxin system prevent-host-death family antitoxin [Chloroflexota bacterium]